MEFRVVTVGEFALQVQVLPEVKLLAVEINGRPIDFERFPRAKATLLDLALHYIRD